jgi:hypothetical protein
LESPCRHIYMWRFCLLGSPPFLHHLEQGFVNNYLCMNTHTFTNQCHNFYMSYFYNSFMSWSFLKFALKHAFRVFYCLEIL